MLWLRASGQLERAAGMSEVVDEVRQLIRRRAQLTPAEHERLRQLCARALFCELCGGGGPGECRTVVAMTARAVDPAHPDVDPNPPLTLCGSCARDYDEHWTNMWDEYNASRR